MSFRISCSRLKTFDATLLCLHTFSSFLKSIIVEYLDQSFPSSPKLLPESSVDRAAVRLFTKECASLFIGPGFRMLKCQDPDEYPKLRLQLRRNLDIISELLIKQSNGPFFLGKDISEVNMERNL